MTAKNSAEMSANSTAASGKKSKGFTDEERAAMKERAQELKAERAGKADGESAVLAKIAEMPEPDRAMGTRLHAIIKASAEPSRRDSGTGCPRMPRTARSSASSKRAEVQDEILVARLQRRRRTSTKAPCGRSPSR